MNDFDPARENLVHTEQAFADALEGARLACEHASEVIAEARELTASLERQGRIAAEQLGRVRTVSTYANPTDTTADVDPAPGEAPDMSEWIRFANLSLLNNPAPDTLDATEPIDDPDLRPDLVALAERQRAEFRSALVTRDYDALAYIDKTIDNVLDVPASVWRSDEIVPMLRELRRILVPASPEEGND